MRQSNLKDLLSISRGVYEICRNRLVSRDGLEKLADFENGLKCCFRLTTSAASSIRVRLKEFPWRSRAFGAQLMIESKEAMRKSGKDDSEKIEDRPFDDLGEDIVESTDSRKQRKVPSSRIGRLVSFGQLAARLAWRWNSADKSGLSDESAEKIVDTLCRVRGAALKLGQMISIQDESVLGLMGNSKRFQAIFERVRKAADFMPPSQFHKMLRSEYGHDWHSKFAEFNEQPFASASIGQVHEAVTLDGQKVAVKIQYPGIANSIDSDIDNVISILKLANPPKGLYLDNMLSVSRDELRQEVDYIAEAQNQRRFHALLAGDSVFYVPEVNDELSTRRILVAEMVKGRNLDRLTDASAQIRNQIAFHLLRLCLSELFLWNFMQTDPNWANFMVEISEGRLKRINLLDFGACRQFDKTGFVDPYMQVIYSASKGDREGIISGSVKLGMLTGSENQQMTQAHCDSVMILGEPFRNEEPFDFGRQNTSKRILALLPTMVKNRLVPPPNETYSLHRKMSGAFLACAKLNASVSCKQLFGEIYSQFRFGP